MQISARTSCDTAWRRFLDELLMTPLQGTSALAQVNHVAKSVTQHLNFNMPGIADVSFHVKRVVAESRSCFRRCGAEGSLHLLRIRHQLDPPPTASGGGFEQHGITNPLGGHAREGFWRDPTGTVATPTKRLSCALQHRPSCRCCQQWGDEGNLAVGAGLGELGPFR